MIEYKALIIDQHETIITGTNLCVFIDTEFTIELFLKLLKIKPKYIFVKNKLLYCEQDIKDERKKILDLLKMGKKLNLEHYSQYDLMNMDCLSHITTNNDSSIDKIFRIIEKKYLIENSNRFFVTEYFINENQYITKLTNLLFNNIDINQIAITNNEQTYFKVVNQLGENDTLIAKASIDNSDKILLIPDDFRFKITPRLVLIVEHDYKYAVNNLFNKKYILGFKDSLKYSEYFKALCDEHQIPRVDNNIAAIIFIVEKYGHLIVSEVENEQLITKFQFTRSNEHYKRLVLVYNHCLKFNIDYSDILSLTQDK